MQRTRCEEWGITVNLRRCEAAAIEQQLKQRNMIDNSDRVQAVLQATGGWSLLLAEFFERCKRQDDVLESTPSFAVELSKPNSELSQSFRGALGLEGKEAALQALEVLRCYGAVTQADVVAELSKNITPVECEAALSFLIRLGYVQRKRETSLLVRDSVPHAENLVIDATLAHVLHCDVRKDT